VVKVDTDTAGVLGERKKNRDDSVTSLDCHDDDDDDGGGGGGGDDVTFIQ